MSHEQSEALSSPLSSLSPAPSRSWTARATSLFPVWTVMVACLAAYHPEPFKPVGPWIAPLLGLVMLLMGLSLRLGDMVVIVRRPWAVCAGLFLHFLIMPTAAWGISLLLGMDQSLTAGMVLVGSVASGTASTVIVYLSRGDVGLSIAIGAVSNIVGTIATPLLTRLFLSADIEVNVLGMLGSIVEIILLPVAAGLVINRVAPKLVRWSDPVRPLCSMLTILLIIGSVVAAGRSSILAISPIILVGVVLHNAVGLFGGYWGGRLMGFDERTCRTLAVEVGMQNSGIAVVLANLYFSPVAALPGVLFSVWHNLSGSTLASFWSRRAVADKAHAE